MGRDGIRNTLIVLPVIGMMAAAGYYLWLDTQTTESVETQQVQREQVGKLIRQVSNVKRKFGESLYWNPLKSDEDLFANDSVRTGPDSLAVIEFSDKSQIELAENSLIVLQKTASALSVDFKTGDIETKGGLAVKVKDALLQSENADLKLSTDSKNNTQILVTKGNATLTDKQNQKLDLSTKKAVQVDESGQAKQLAVPLVLNTPKDGISVLDPDAVVTYPFTWTVLDEALKEEFLEVSATPEFQKISFRKSAHQAAKGQIARGLNYWRVGWTGADKKPVYSEVRTLKLEEDKRLVLTSPHNNSVIDFQPGQESVNFAWEALGQPQLFLIEVAKDPTFDTMITNKTTNLRSLEIPGFKEGHFYWRVRAFGENNTEIGKTGVASFTIRKILPQLPVLVLPPNGFKWTLNDPLAVEWKANEAAKQYRLLITKDPEQSNISHQATTAETKYLWKWVQAGDYYWAVHSLNEKSEIIGKSFVQKFSIQPTVTGPAIVLKEPPSQETVTRDRRDPMDPVIFQWDVERPIAAGPFVFYISEKPDFQPALKRENIESTRFSLRIDRPANYYWKVEWTNPKDPKDKEISLPSVMKYRISNNLPPPALIEPLAQAKKFVAQKEKVEFRWTRVPGAASYRLTIERESPTTQEKIPVVSTVTSNDQALSMPLEPGTYFWNVSSVDKQKIEGPASQSRTFVIELNKELAAPKLKPPVIK